MNKIKRGDTVLVTAGKDRGKRGQVRFVLPKKQRAVVEGVNMIKRHQRQRSQTQPGGIIEREAPIHVSNLVLIDPRTDRPTRVGFGTRPDGRKTRISKTTGEAVD